jgi:hypothetical protein
LRELRAKVTHDPVARDLRDHARRGDAQADAITIDNRRLRKWETESPASRQSKRGPAVRVTLQSLGASHDDSRGGC